MGPLTARFFSYVLIIYLAAPGLACNMQDLLVAARGV